MTTCTQDQPRKFAVSLTTGTGIDGAVLNVRALVECRDEEQARRIGDRSPAACYLSGRTVMVRADHDGREFATREEAEAFKLDHGYVRPWHSTAMHAQRVEKVERWLDAGDDDMVRGIYGDAALLWHLERRSPGARAARLSRAAR